jgi:hypothetical protein
VSARSRPWNPPQLAGAARGQRRAYALLDRPSSRRSSIEPGKITVKSALRASQVMAQAPLLTPTFHGSLGAYRKDGQERTYPTHSSVKVDSTVVRSKDPLATPLTFVAVADHLILIIGLRAK